LAAGPGDPTQRVTADELVRASRTPEGPATLHLRLDGPETLQARAWGSGADWALGQAPDLVGLSAPAPVEPSPDDPPALQRMARRALGMRLPRTRRVVELLTLIVLQQKVSGKESKRAFHHLVREFSEPAPGPAGLSLPLSPEQLRELPPAAFQPLGILARQGETLQRIGWHATRLEQAAEMEPAEAERRLRAVPGIGIWSARLALLHGLGDADAVPLGDWNLPSAVAFNLVGEERADDARMLELLEPYRGRRGVVIRWIMAGGKHPPRRGPRMPLRPVPREGRALLRRVRGAGTRP
jgi:3-methyladenine DNA glycosylase/8-oxoguanine DNA glycosylase